MQKNLALEDQIVHLLQQNEDLNVRVDNSQTLIQYVQHSSGTVAPPAGAPQFKGNWANSDTQRPPV